MQLHFTMHELNELAELLERRDTESCNRIRSAAPGAAKDALQRQQVIGEALLDKVMTRHLEFAADELDSLADILAELDQLMRVQMAHADDGSELWCELQRKKALLQSIRDKVTEACAMA